MKTALVYLLMTSMSAIAAPVAIVIHGGAGNEQRPPAAEEKQRHATLERALRAGHELLLRGGSAMDAVEAAIVVLEDSPLFNAGKGAVFTSEGKNELDASIMEGRTRGAGAVGNVTTVKNPIRAARAVMERSPHVLLVGHGAEEFARRNGIEIVAPDYFRTEERWRELQEWKAKQTPGKPQSANPAAQEHLGTVGCVALDQNGTLAAGTSTGGMTGKQPGRLGDSPLIGAGTYADNRACGISCTGHGEFFIRNVVAFDIAARMRYQNQPLADAARVVVQEVLRPAGGRGGIIGIDREANIVVEFNTAAMARGSIDRHGKLSTATLGR